MTNKEYRAWVFNLESKEDCNIVDLRIEVPKGEEDRLRRIWDRKIDVTTRDLSD